MNGHTWSCSDANWTDGVLAKEDVAAAVRELGESMQGLPTQRILDCQHRFIQMACDINRDLHATPGEIKDVLHTWHEFHKFLTGQTNQQQGDG